MQSKFYFILLLFIGCHFISISHLKSQNEIQKEIEALLSEFESSDKPGVAVSVVMDGKVIYNKGLGMANLEYNVPITENTVFHAASIAKQFTAFAILLLEMEGKLSLDDDVKKYIAELPDFGHVITLKHLATHSSGLKDQWRLLELAGWRLDDVITRDQILKLVSKQQSLNFPPGDEISYSNTGFTLLAEVVSRVSGQSFAEFTEERIFKPLGMNDSQFYDDHERIVKNRAHSYTVEDEIYKKKTLSFANVGATSLLTTVDDIAKWAINFQKPVVGNAVIFEKMKTGMILNSGNQTGYALGQMVGTYEGIDLIVHSASDAGFRGFFVRSDEHNVAIVVLANSSEIEPINYAIGILGILLEGELEEEESEERADFIPDPSSFVDVTKETMMGYTGRYWQPDEGYPREIRCVNDTLIYDRPGGNKTDLVAVGESEFKMLGDKENVSVVFNTDKDGHDRMQVLINDDEPIDFFRFSDVVLDNYVGYYFSPELGSSYNLIIKDGSLVLEHLRRDDVEFEPINNSLFKTRNRNFHRVEFERAKDGRVLGFYASNSGARNNWFQKK